MRLVQERELMVAKPTHDEIIRLVSLAGGLARRAGVISTRSEYHSRPLASRTAGAAAVSAGARRFVNGPGPRGAAMLAYPKVPGSKGAPAGRCLAFEKYDGTNLHWVWDREFGWIRFGTRRDSFYLDGRGTPDFHAAHPGLD